MDVWAECNETEATKHWLSLSLILFHGKMNTLISASITDINNKIIYFLKHPPPHPASWNRMKDLCRLWPMGEPLSSQLIVTRPSWWICSVTFSVFISSALILAKWWYSGLLARLRPPRRAHIHTHAHAIAKTQCIHSPNPTWIVLLYNTGKGASVKYISWILLLSPDCLSEPS